jgi:hypothetical protein
MLSSGIIDIRPLVAVYVSRAHLNVSQVTQRARRPS